LSSKAQRILHERPDGAQAIRGALREPAVEIDTIELVERLRDAAAPRSTSHLESVAAHPTTLAHIWHLPTRVAWPIGAGWAQASMSRRRSSRIARGR